MCIVAFIILDSQRNEKRNDFRIMCVFISHSCFYLKTTFSIENCPLQPLGLVLFVSRYDQEVIFPGIYR